MTGATTTLTRAGVQRFACHEGQALAFIERAIAQNYSIPAYLLNAWDAALAAAGSTIGKGNPKKSDEILRNYKKSWELVGNPKKSKKIIENPNKS